MYTTNHMNYNMSAFSVAGRAYFCLLFIFASENNFHLKIRNKFLSFFLCFILSIARAVILTYYICVVFPDIIYFYLDTWFLNTNNWWVSKSEPFFTNESIFNAIICWFLWSLLILSLQIIVYIYLPLLLIVLLYALIVYISKNGSGAICKAICVFFYYAFHCIKNIIIGRALTAYIQFI